MDEVVAVYCQHYRNPDNLKCKDCEGLALGETCEDFTPDTEYYENYIIE
jgi:hypothetical protein